MVASEPDLVKILVAVMTLLAAIIGVLDPGALGGNTTNTYITSYPEDSGYSDQITLNVPSVSESSPESKESIDVTPVTPTRPEKDTSPNDIKRHHRSNTNENGLSNTNENGLSNTNENVNKVEDPKINSFDVTHDKITAGESTTLSWSVSGAAHITISPDVGNVQSSGSKIIYPAKTTTYTITATSEAGIGDKEVAVFVEEVEPPKINYLKVDSEKITAGKSVELSWSVSDATDITIDHDVGSVEPTGSRIVTPTEETTYTLTATNGAESNTETVTVSVEEIEPLTIDYFEIDSENITAGDSAELSWSVSGATDILIDPDIGSVSSDDSVKVYPAETTTYIIKATNGVESTEDTATIYVEEVKPPVIDSFEAYPEEITAGDSAELSWSVSDATDVFIDPDIGSVSSGDLIEVYPAETTTYIITATNGVESIEDTATVYVEVIEPPSVDSFEVYPEEITAGDSAEVSWSVSGATDILIDPDIGSVSSDDSVEVYPAETTTYIITATNGVESTTETVTVYVEEIEPLESDPLETDSEEMISEESTEF